MLVGAFIVDPAGTRPSRDERVMVISMWADTLVGLDVKLDEADRVDRLGHTPPRSSCARDALPRIITEIPVIVR